MIPGVEQMQQAARLAAMALRGVEYAAEMLMDLYRLYPELPHAERVAELPVAREAHLITRPPGLYRLLKIMTTWESAATAAVVLDVRLRRDDP